MWKKRELSISPPEKGNPRSHIPARSSVRWELTCRLQSGSSVIVTSTPQVIQAITSQVATARPVSTFLCPGFSHSLLLSLPSHSGTIHLSQARQETTCVSLIYIKTCISVFTSICVCNISPISSRSVFVSVSIIPRKNSSCVSSRPPKHHLFTSKN